MEKFNELVKKAFLDKFNTWEKLDKSDYLAMYALSQNQFDFSTGYEDFINIVTKKGFLPEDYDYIAHITGDNTYYITLENKFTEVQKRFQVFLRISWSDLDKKQVLQALRINFITLK